MARNNSSVSGVGEGFDLRRRNNRFIGLKPPIPVGPSALTFSAKWDERLDYLSSPLSLSSKLLGENVFRLLLLILNFPEIDLRPIPCRAAYLVL